MWWKSMTIRLPAGPAEMGVNALIKLSTECIDMQRHLRVVCLMVFNQWLDKSILLRRSVSLVRSWSATSSEAGN